MALKGKKVGMINDPSNKVVVRPFYDVQQWEIGETYRIRVSHIYDLAKFWIVLLEKELTLFQNFLHKLYTKDFEQYKIPEQIIKCKMYCVAYVDDTFYRGQIVEIPYFGESIQRAAVFLIDYGQVVFVKFNDLFYFYRKLYQVPYFSVRASLSWIEPFHSDFWPLNVIQRFSDLVTNKILLCTLESTDVANKIVYITITDFDQHSQAININDLLINEKLAVPSTTKREKNKPSSSKYPCLFPPFEEIENCKVTTAAKYFEYIKPYIYDQILV